MADLIQFITKGKIVLPVKTILVDNVPVIQDENTITITHDLVGTDYDILINVLYGVKIIPVTVVTTGGESGGTGTGTGTGTTSASADLPYLFISELSSESFKVTFSSHYYNKTLKWRVFE